MDFWPRLYDDQTASLMKYTGNEKKITVPHIIAGYVTTAISRWAFTYMPFMPSERAFYREPFIEEITVEEGYETLYHGAFYNCTELRKLSLPSTMKTFSGDPFETCDKLTEITFPNGNDCFRFKDGKLTSADGKTVYFTVKDN